jgi:NAD+ synthase (glutamine-hydrolysing)
MNQKFGFARVSVCSPRVSVANPRDNLAEVVDLIGRVADDTDVFVFPELGITGYTCGNLFPQTVLREEAEEAVARIANHMGWKASNEGNRPLVFVGAPVQVGTELFNCAIAIHTGKIIGIIPKQNIPTYNEFYEGRHFAAATGDEPKEIDFAGHVAPFGTDLLFRCGGLVVFAEICEDLWMPVPPSSHAAVAGANLLVNLSASNETVAKSEYRTDLVRNQSGRCVAAYAYASAGPSESTSDLIFSGHCLIAENGRLLTQSPYVGDGQLNFASRWAVADIDFQRLNTERIIQRSFGDANRHLPIKYRTVEWEARERKTGVFFRQVPALPFVPSELDKLSARCATVFDLQVAGLVGRMTNIRKSTGSYPKLNIGVSGGSDSTLALLVCQKACLSLGLPPSYIRAKTMPGFGTTNKTREIAHAIMGEIGTQSEEIDIRPSCLQQYKDLKHSPFGIDIRSMTVEEFAAALNIVQKADRHDLVFENVQARMRTSLLMNSGFVVGTGDMSELALGWCTYNGDHMSMYNVNASVPKTLVKFIIRHVAGQCQPGRLQDALLKCSSLTVSPELLPAAPDGTIEQSTEDVLGPYELHDFFLLNMVRYGFSPTKTLFLARRSDLVKKYQPSLMLKTLETFVKRFFSQQFKRNCVPDGPKVGSVSLSPRGDWRMPSDADAAAWLADIERAKHSHDWL